MTEGAPKPQPILVGRQHELESVWHLLEESTTSRLRVALISGEPGIGKTRLLQEVARRAEQMGTLVLRGGASEAEGMPPYLPFLEALGQHIRATAPDALHQQTGAMASVLTTILPELSVRLVSLPSSYQLPPEQARLRLYEAVGAFLAAIAASHGLVLLLDDLQWADTATLDLLCHIAHHQPNAPLFVLGAYREGEVTHRSAFKRALTELTRLRRLHTTTLGPLTAPELAALATSTLGATVTPTVSQLLHRQSEGNPFFAEELLRDWLETGTLARDHTTFRLVTPVDPTLPSSIANAVHQRLARLPPPVIELLGMGAIIGRRFDVALLAEVADQEAESVEEQLREASQTRLIRADHPGTFTFSHDTIRECLYSEVSSARRTRLHTLIGRKLEQRLNRGDAHMDVHRLADLAYHFAHSGDRELGASYSQLAAKQARDAYASEEAAMHYRTALTLLSGDDPRRGDWLLGLGEAARLSRSLRDALGAFQAAQDWALRRGDSAAAGRAALELGRTYWQLEELGLAQTALMQAVELLADGTTAEAVQAYVELGSLLVLSLHEYTQARDHLERALTLARQLGNRHLEAAASRALGTLLVRTNQLERGIPLLEQALTQATAVDDAMEAAECCVCLAQAYGWQGERDRAEDLLLRRLEFARRCHDPYQLRHSYSQLALPPMLRGEWAKAEEMLAQSQAIVEHLASPEPLALLHHEHSWLAYFQGAYDVAETLASESVARFRALSPRSLIWWLGWLGIIWAFQDKRQETLGTLDELETLIAPLPAEAMPTAHALCSMAAMVTRLDNRPWAVRLYPRLLAFRGQMHPFSVDRLLGALAVLLGDWTAARTHLAAAEERSRRLAFRYELALTMEAQADLALAQGGRGSAAQASTRLEEAMALFEQLGNHAEERRLRDRLGQIAGGGERPRLPAGLSPREAEVLRLVAQGLSNRDIALALSISERTVANHLVSIFNKVGVDNRAAATAFALRHGLVK
jgi:predicted ATPase/DNA-binding CsgD family transcriptional regulator